MTLHKARVIPLEAANLDRLHRLAARSIFWEIDPLGDTYAGIDDAVDKAGWLIAQVYEQKLAGFSIIDPARSTGAYATLLMCPPAAAPGAVRIPTAPPSPDAFLITSLHIDAAAADIGWEAVLIDAAVVELTSRSLPAVEAFGLRPEYLSASGTRPEPPTGNCRQLVADAAKIGLIPLPALESAGFKIVADHPVIPRLRLDLPPEHGLLTEREIAELLAEVPAVS